MRRLGCLTIQTRTDKYLVECAAPYISAEEELNKHFETTINTERAYQLALTAFDGNEKIASSYAAAASKRESNDRKSKSPK